MNFLRYLFYLLIVRPVIHLVLGVNIRHRNRLPIDGPALIVANHNSHLDTMALMTLFPQSLLKKVRPVAAADYFLRNKWMAWFSQNIIGIIPISRKSASKANLFDGIQANLDSGNIVILFPEGSRGQPEQMVELKRGIAILARKNPQLPIYPVFMYGLGKSLPKDESLLVPFVVDVVAGEPLSWQGDKDQFMQLLAQSFQALKGELVIQDWE